MSWFKTPEDLALQKEIADKRNHERDLQKLLDNTDHKVLPDYDQKEAEDLEVIKDQRSKWRSEIRDVQNWLNQNAPDQPE